MPKIDSLLVLALDVVNENFNGVFIFSGVRWALVCKNGSLDICVVAIECIILCGFHVVFVMSTLITDGAAEAILFNLGLVTHVDVLVLS